MKTKIKILTGKRKYDTINYNYDGKFVTLIIGEKYYGSRSEMGETTW